ncbi:MAG: phosphatase PAP2-related protein [Patescibacteria group bacterium]
MTETRTPVPLHRHPRPHAELWRRYRHYGAQQEFRVSVLLSVLTFAASLIVSFFAIGYSTERASNPVTDIILSNTPIFDVDGLFVYGTFFFIVLGAALIAAHPKRIPFALHTIALFYFIRAAFITLTHLGPFPMSGVDSFDFGTVIGRMFFGGDLFFSGHTGLAFLMALMFWHEKRARYFFLAASVYFGAIVLLGHLHYSIDVASAFFITYGIFHIAEWLFPKDRAIFLADEGEEA